MIKSILDYLDSQSTFNLIKKEPLTNFKIVPQNKTTAKSIRKCYELMAARSRLMHDALSRGRRAGQEKYCGVFVVTRQEQKHYENKGERIYEDMRFIVYF